MDARSTSPAPETDSQPGPATAGTSAPAVRSRWAAAVFSGLVAAGLLALGLVWLAPPGLPQVSDGLVLTVFGLSFAGPCITLGWLLFVAPRTVKPYKSPGDTVENRWARSAGLGAFGDVMWLSAVGAGVTSLLAVEAETHLVLLAVIVAGGLSFGLRYLVVRRRES